jgi:HCOMODA/2-hydroxy-3-carboxy-muconic semialdehyde decarboxylase
MSTSTSPNAQQVHELVLANHILALEGVLDAYGHVSIRNPSDSNTFLMSRSRSAEIVADDDILVHDLNGSVAGIPDRELYLERFIHSSIYATRPDVGAVIHSHSDAILPFSISNLPLRAVFHSASLIGSERVPVWDSHTEFGDTNLLVETTAMGESLTRKLENRALVLMRGHGFAAAAKSLINALKMATALPRNARALLDVLQAGGEVTPLSPGEVATHGKADMSTPAAQRQWEYWCRRLGEPYQPVG